MRATVWLLVVLLAAWTGRALPLRHVHSLGEEVLEHVHLVLGGANHHGHGDHHPHSDQGRGAHHRHHHPHRHSHPAPEPDPRRHEPGETHGGHDQGADPTLLLILAAAADAAPPVLEQGGRAAPAPSRCAAAPLRSLPLRTALPRGPPAVDPV